MANSAEGKAAGVGSWHPTVVNLGILVVVELIAYAALRYAFNKIGA